MTPAADILSQVLIVDDDREMRESMEHFLGRAGFATRSVKNGQAAIEHISREMPDVLVSDLRMPGMSGIDLLKILQKQAPLLPVVLISAHGDVPMAVEAMQKGAYSFLEKPFDPPRLMQILNHASGAHRLARENDNLRQRVSQLTGLDQILLGDSPPMQELKQDIRAYATTDATLLILGETGTGKEVVARTLHDLSHRANGPFIAVNCAAIPENLFEASMFGHVAGAFTGASSAARGYFASASGGTLFLDELGACPVNQQAKLLRALESREVMPVGSSHSEKVDIRVISATNENLEQQVQEGRFREDLLYRLNILIFKLPPLRELGEDIILLYTHFLSEFAATYGTMAPTLGNEDIATLLAHDWPGNVRELRHAAERRILAYCRGRGGVAETLGSWGNEGEETENLRQALGIYERRLIMRAMKEHHGEMDSVASALGIGRRTLNEKLVKYAINRADFI